MTPELEKLIDLALADGQLTDKEKQVLFKKADALGVDIDEFEMVLDAKLFQATRTTTKTEKIGEIKKCPSCGATVTAFSSSCVDCGFEFRNVSANTSVKLLSDKLESVISECNRMSFSDSNIIGRLTDTKERQDQRKEEEILNRQREIIKNFPIPNTREDILELLYFISPKTKTGFTSDKNISAWRNKFSEIIARAKIAFANDSKMKSEIEKFETQQKSSLVSTIISKFNELPQKMKLVVLLVCLYAGGGIVFTKMGSNQDEGIKKEKERLELIVSKVNEAMKNKNYDEAEILTSQIKWEFTGGYSPTETDKLSKSWEEKEKKF